jgi:hypothetical protein
MVTEENNETLSQDSRSPGRDLNPRPPEYELRVLITRQRRSTRRAGGKKIVEEK